MKTSQKNYNKGVQLITYADSLGENLSDLDFVLDKYFKDVVAGVHILPFYPSSSDRGFSPLSHRQINPAFGKAEDIKKISSKYPMMADLIINHISGKSKYFQNYLKLGDRSKYRSYFIEARSFARRWHKIPKNKYWRKVFFAFGQISIILRNLDFIFHKHGINRIILKKIYRPRLGSPFVPFRRKDGTQRYLWCTFSSDQIDLNTESAAVRKKFQRDIKYLSKLGVKYIRLDAAAYAVKRKGTSNFLIPETTKLINWLCKISHKHGMEVLPEIHHHYKTQLLLSGIKRVDYVYDFALPFLMLHALYKEECRYLKKWIKIRPLRSVSTLDTHDGIGVVDVEDLLPQAEIKDIYWKILTANSNAATRASGSNSNNVDLYQMNCTYYSALVKDDKAYLAARVIQLFLPGIPQIYYVGLLAGENDLELLQKTQHGRDINRHYYSLSEIENEVNREVVKELFSLCKLRNTHKAFQGRFSLLESDDHIIKIEWKNGKVSLGLEVDFKTKEYKIRGR
ncbi:MAG: sucrose phosphorylase [Patescibacteria group bacterium]|nr:sucrose phosphorylase [Patescibacteria group bacterium]